MIGGITVQASMTDDVQESTNLLDLNDDCLRAILVQLNLEDLQSVAEVCGRLQDQARVVYASNWQNSTLYASSVEQAQSYLKSFGPAMKTLRFLPSKQLRKDCSNEMVSALVEYCSGPLTFLEVHDITFDSNNEFIAKSHTLLTRVQKFTLKK